MQRHGASGAAISIVERTDLGSQVIKREVQKEREERRWAGQGQEWLKTLARQMQSLIRYMVEPMAAKN